MSSARALLSYILCGAFLLIASLVLDIISSTHSINAKLKFVYRLLPTYCFSEAIANIIDRSSPTYFPPSGDVRHQHNYPTASAQPLSIHRLCSHLPPFALSSRSLQSLFAFDIVGWDFIYMALSAHCGPPLLVLVFLLHCSSPRVLRSVRCV